MIMDFIEPTIRGSALNAVPPRDKLAIFLMYARTGTCFSSFNLFLVVNRRLFFFSVVL
jgi:hypothetical protein